MFKFFNSNNSGNTDNSDNNDNSGNSGNSSWMNWLNTFNQTSSSNSDSIGSDNDGNRSKRVIDEGHQGDEKRTQVISVSYKPLIDEFNIQLSSTTVQGSISYNEYILNELCKHNGIDIKDKPTSQKVQLLYDKGSFEVSETLMNNIQSTSIGIAGIDSFDGAHDLALIEGEINYLMEAVKDNYGSKPPNMYVFVSSIGFFAKAYPLGETTYNDVLLTETPRSQTAIYNKILEIREKLLKDLENKLNLQKETTQILSVTKDVDDPIETWKDVLGEIEGELGHNICVVETLRNAPFKGLDRSNSSYFQQSFLRSEASNNLDKNLSCMGKISKEQRCENMYSDLFDTNSNGQTIFECDINTICMRFVEPFRFPDSFIFLFKYGELTEELVEIIMSSYFDRHPVFSHDVTLKGELTSLINNFKRNIQIDPNRICSLIFCKLYPGSPHIMIIQFKEVSANDVSAALGQTLKRPGGSKPMYYSTYTDYVRPNNIEEVNKNLFCCYQLCKLLGDKLTIFAAELLLLISGQNVCVVTIDGVLAAGCVNMSTLFQSPYQNYFTNVLQKSGEKMEATSFFIDFSIYVEEYLKDTSEDKHYFRLFCEQQYKFQNDPIVSSSSSDLVSDYYAKTITKDRIDSDFKDEFPSRVDSILQFFTEFFIEGVKDYPKLISLFSKIHKYKVENLLGTRIFDALYEDSKKEFISVFGVISTVVLKDYSVVNPRTSVSNSEQSNSYINSCVVATAYCKGLYTKINDPIIQQQFKDLTQYLFAKQMNLIKNNRVLANYILLIINNIKKITDSTNSNSNSTTLDVYIGLLRTKIDGNVSIQTNEIKSLYVGVRDYVLNFDFKEDTEKKLLAQQQLDLITLVMRSFCLPVDVQKNIDIKVLTLDNLAKICEFIDAKNIGEMIRSTLASTAISSVAPSTANSSVAPSTANSSIVNSTANSSIVNSTANSSIVNSTANSSIANSTAISKQNSQSNNFASIPKISRGISINITNNNARIDEEVKGANFSLEIADENNENNDPIIFEDSLDDDENDDDEDDMKICDTSPETLLDKIKREGSRFFNLFERFWGIESDDEEDNDASATGGLPGEEMNLKEGGSKKSRKHKKSFTNQKTRRQNKNSKKKTRKLKKLKRKQNTKYKI